MKCTFVSVGSEKKSHFAESQGPTICFYFILFFFMSQLDTNGCLIFFLLLFFFKFAKSHYCLCQTEHWAVGQWPFLAC